MSEWPVEGAHLTDGTIYTRSYPYKQWVSSAVTPHHENIYASREEGWDEQKPNYYMKGRQKKRNVAELRSQILELDSTKQRLIYNLVTKNGNGKPTGGEMDCEQAPHLVDDLRRSANGISGVNYFVG